MGKLEENPYHGFRRYEYYRRVFLNLKAGSTE